MKTTTKSKCRRISSRVLSISLVLALLIMFFPLSAIAGETSENQDTVMVFILDNNTYTADGELIVMDVSPSIIESRTMLPIRYAATPLGADVSWDNETKKVTVSLGETKMELWIGQNNALVNGSTVPIDPDNVNVKPLIINGRTMLPLRFVTEALGCDVQWDAVARKITITKTGSSGGAIIKPDLPPISKDIVKLPSVTKETPAQLSKLTSVDISKLKNVWGIDSAGKAYKVTMSEADIPVVMRVGRGYDVFGKYASVDSLKQPVLDTEKLIQEPKNGTDPF
ncbi:MAG: copper amine oxidase N-terminal domain-containing protein [Dehalobacter sp.]|nr:copper amine oxidase N-terminal domain-containing protein [Dehalobacter sp.]